MHKIQFAVKKEMHDVTEQYNRTCMSSTWAKATEAKDVSFEESGQLIDVELGSSEATWSVT